MQHPGIRRLLAARAKFADDGAAWWITPAEATRLIGWSRQETHRLVRIKTVAIRRQQAAEGRQMIRINGADLVSYLRSRTC